MLWKDLANKKIGLWGMGKEGQATQQMLLKHVPSAHITCISEENVSDIFTSDIVVKSPGVCLYRPEIQTAQKRGIQFTSGTNLFMSNKNPKTKVVCVTGTKGKSTTCSLLAHTLKGYSCHVGLGGNIGLPLISLVDQNLDIVVAETSSYQCADFVGTPDIGVMMALYSAHLPWHGTLEKYHADKRHMLQQAKTIVELTTNPITIQGGYFCDQKPLFSVESLPLFGEHNQKNACVVLRVLQILGFDPQLAQKSFESFVPLKHRLQPCGSVNQVLYINDSIATLPEPVMAALDTFRMRPITLIVGGWDGGYDYTRLNQMIQDRNILAIALPDTGNQITTAHHVPNMQRAVLLAHQLTPVGGVVLMSPGAPSYNQYNNFEERGEDFMNLVQKLKDNA